MTKKNQRKALAKYFRKKFRVDFVESFKQAKSGELHISAVHPSLKRFEDVEMCEFGHIHNVVRVYATDGGLYTFVDGYLW